MVIMNRRFFAGILALVLWGWQFAQATTIVSPERASLGQLATAIKVYLILHNGQRVTSWAEVREIYDLDAANNNLRGKPAYPLEEHYEFISQQVPFPGYEGSNVVMIRTVPLQRAEGQPKWRYLVGRTKDGDLTATRLSEEEVQAMFQQAGVPLPMPKTGLAAVEIEAMPKLGEPPPTDQPAQPSTTPTKHAVAPEPMLSGPATPAPTTVAVAKTPSRWPWIGVGMLVLIVGWFVWKRRG